MEKVAAEIAQMRKESEATAASMQLLLTTAQNLGAWMPTMDSTMEALRISIDAVGGHVTVLESGTSLTAPP